jgi:hypothetical protein
MSNKWNVDGFLGNSFEPMRLSLSDGIYPIFGSVYFEDFENLTGYLH